MAKSSRYRTTEYNRYERMRARVLDIYSRARVYHFTHGTILERMRAEVYDTPDYRRMSQLRQAQLSEVVRMSSAAVQRELVWRLGPAEGPLPESEQGKWPEGGTLSTLCRIPGALYGAHYWTGTDCPFGEYKATN